MDHMDDLFVNIVCRRTI